MKIYVVTHKKADLRLPEGYELFQVGAAKNGAFCENNDAVGDDNISAKNPNYCELTAAYWIWKNDKTSDIMGLMHYRRFLTLSRRGETAEYALSESEVNEILQSYDYISTPLYKNKPSVKSIMCDFVREHDYRLLRESVERLYPDYINTFDEVFGGKYTYFCNMFVTRKHEWDEYCEWLFSILFDMERSVDMTGYSDEEKRLYGYLSERLFTVYVRHNAKKVKSVRMIHPHKSLWSRFVTKLKRRKREKSSVGV